MEDLFKPLGCLENIIDNNVINKQKQLTLHHNSLNEILCKIFKNTMCYK